MQKPAMSVVKKIFRKNRPIAELLRRLDDRDVLPERDANGPGLALRPDDDDFLLPISG